MSVLIDGTGQMSVGQVAESTGWETVDTSLYSGGYGAEVLWFRLSAIAARDGAAVLSVRPSFLDQVFFYLPASTAVNPGEDAGNGLILYRQGDRLPIAKRPYGVRGFAVSVALKADRSETLYVRVETTSSRLFFADLNWGAAFVSNIAKESVLVGASYMVICSMLVFAGVQWLRTRSRIYAAHIGLASAVGLFYFTRNGDFSILFPEFPMLADRMVGIAVCLALGALVLFVAQTLPARGGLALGKWPSSIFMAVIVLSTGLAIAGYYSWIAAQFAVLIIASIVYLVALSIMARDGPLTLRLARVIALSLYLPTGLVNLGLLDFYWQAELCLNLGTVGLLVVLVAIAWHEDTRRRRAYAMALDDARTARIESELKERSMALHKQWVSIFSHEIKTPLSIIDSSRANIAKIEGSPDVVDRTNKIRRAVDAIDGLVATMLAVEELETRIDSAVDQTVDLHGIVTDCIRDLGNPNATSLCPPGLWVQADPTLIRIAISSLLVNGEKHGRKGGRIQVSAVAAGVDGAVVVVTSEGEELSPDIAHHLFEKHFRTAKSTGHGIGLWAASAIAKRYGGGTRYSHDTIDGNMFAVSFRDGAR